MTLLTYGRSDYDYDRVIVTHNKRQNKSMVLGGIFFIINRLKQQMLITLNAPYKRVSTIAYCLLPIASSLFPVPCSLFPVPCSL
ncbi:MAG: hypothetical protein F6K56_01255 [Moorea sp. SIO3G5]|nr:hypothetical protein [Moorena sp. SIO3G5]